MPRKASRKTLVKKLDKAVSEYIRGRDGWCVVCGSDYQLGNSHIFTRKNYSTRWDVSDAGNCHAGCWKCNFYHSSVEQWKYFNWYIDKFGQDNFDELYRRHKTVIKFTTYDLEVLLQEIEVKRLTTGR